MDTVRRRGRVSPLVLRFFVQRGLDLEPVIVELPRSGSLAPLYRAFKLDITEGSAEEMALLTEDDMSLLDWLAETVRDAVRTSAEHNQLKVALREKMAAIEDTHNLGGVSLAVSEFAISTADQKCQLEALAVLDDALHALELDTLSGFEGLVLVMQQRASRECERSHVGSDGSIKIIVEDVNSVQGFLREADTKRARACQQVATYWRTRAKGVAPKLAQVLRVKAVIGEYEWTGDVSGARDFALFAGRLLESYESFDAALDGRDFSYTVLVHGDHASGAVEYTDRSCVVQVRNDCGPEDIIDFQTSEQNESVERHVRDEMTLREEEAAILDQVRDALSAKTVISLCSPREHDLVLAAGRRLLAAAPQIRGAVDLTGASICIDDCYDAWDNGFVSLPYDFSVGEIAPALIRLLSNGIKDSSSGSYDTPGNNNGSPLRSTVPHALHTRMDMDVKPSHVLRNGAHRPARVVRRGRGMQRRSMSSGMRRSFRFR